MVCDPSHTDNQVRHGSVDRPLEPSIVQDGKGSLVRGRLGHPGTKSIKSGLDDDDVVGLESPSIKNGPFVHGVDERHHTCVALIHRGAHEYLAGPAGRDFKDQQGWPKEDNGADSRESNEDGKSKQSGAHSSSGPQVGKPRQP